jgi:hypothetical protein
MKDDSPFRYMEERVFPGIDGLEVDLQGIFGSEELEEYGVESGDELLTEETEEVRSYETGYEDFDFHMSVELGEFEGSRSIGISAEAGNRLQDEVISGLVREIADAYDTSRRTLGHGDYILDITDW